jgi:hypothetical protein
MAFDKFLIAPFNSGLQTNLRPFMIMDDAFESLNNAYAFRGRIRKRFGSLLMGNSQLLSRLRVQVGTVGAAISPVPGSPGSGAIGQMFSAGPDIFTVYQANGAMFSTNPAASGTFNIATGVFTITDAGQAGKPIYWYPALPVMGLTNYEKGPINNQPSYAFDTKFAYIWNNGWSRSGTLLLHGSNLNFVWTCNWEGLTPDIVTMFITNFQVTNPNGAQVPNDDPIWYTSDGNTWVPLNAQAGSNAFYFLPTGLARYTGPYVLSAKIIVAFKDRLLLLNTIENNNSSHNGTAGTNTAYPNRARFSFNGSPFAQNAWYEPNTSDTSGTVGGLSNAAGGGWIDATTDEQIVSAEFIKDRLIVYFERSTWEIAYTGNDKQPFLFQKLNTELGAESTFSVVPFDKDILCISNVGVHSCNGSNVVRIDDLIPDQIFELKNKGQATMRVAGIRDYDVECVYWNYVPNTQNALFTYPSKVLLYNYRNQSWAVNDDVVTAWGYFEQSTDITWSSTSLTWQEFTNAWNDGVTQAQSRQIIAGNQQGWVFIVFSDEARNSPSMQITNMTSDPINGVMTLTIIDHTLEVDQYVALENTGLTIVGVPDPLHPGQTLNVIFPVITVIDANTIIVGPGTFTGTYAGGGTAARVSKPQIQGKQWNPYDKQNKNVYIQRIDFAVQATESDPQGIGGQILVDYSPSSSDVSMITASIVGVNPGTGILETNPYNPIYYPLEQSQDRLNHSVYLQTSGTCVQINMYLNNLQMQSPVIAWADFQMESLTLYTQPVGRMQ